MKIKTIYYSSHFARAFKKLPPEIQKEALKKEKLFRKDCFDHKLKTHKLKGELKNYWSFSINYSFRILFEFINDQEVAFIDIGNHQIYQ